jgi:CheY-like chemotaxis protein
MKVDSLPHSLRNNAGAKSSSGATGSIRRRAGYFKPWWVSLTERASAREWKSVLEHEAPFSGGPLPVCEKDPADSGPRLRCVLIADDDAVVRGSLAAVLEFEGFAVHEARNGIEAVTRSIEHPPDLVLLDLNMPHWDGWTAFGQLDRVTTLLPVIVITARPNQYNKAVDLGVDAFMEKPLNIPILVRAVNRLTSEDKVRHFQRVTKPDFVTELLGGAGT